MSKYEERSTNTWEGRAKEAQVGLQYFESLNSVLVALSSKNFTTICATSSFLLNILSSQGTSKGFVLCIHTLVPAACILKNQGLVRPRVFCLNSRQTHLQQLRSSPGTCSQLALEEQVRLLRVGVALVCELHPWTDSCLSASMSRKDGSSWLVSCLAGRQQDQPRRHVSGLSNLHSHFQSAPSPKDARGER